MNKGNKAEMRKFARLSAIMLQLRPNGKMFSHNI